MILVTTPTGDIGSRVLTKLLEAKEDVRVIARDSSKLSDDVKGAVDVVMGSHADEAVICKALYGVNAVFWLPPGSPTAANAHAGYVEFSEAFVRALPTSGVKNVVGVSALGRGWGKPAGLVSASLAMDETIANTGVAYRALACASLMDNQLRQLEPIRTAGKFYAPHPSDLKLPHVAKSDVANVAVGLLTSRDWRGFEDVPLLGPADITFEEMGRVMSNVLGGEITFRSMPIEQFEGMMQSIGTSEGMVRDYASMMIAKNEGMDHMLPNAPRTNTPTTFRQWCEDELKPALGDI